MTPAVERSLEQATDALEHADTRPRRGGRRRAALYLMVLLLSLPVLLHALWQLDRVARSQGAIASSYQSAAVPPPHAWARDASPRQRLLLLGDAGAAGAAARWRPLWESEPDNPAFLAQYAAGSFSVHRGLPAEILAAAARIDPDNGWYPATAAAAGVEKAVSKQALSRQDQQAGKTPVWEIHDGTRLAEALALVHQAAAKSRFTSYQGELFQQRRPLLGPRTDFLSQIRPIVSARRIVGPIRQIRLIRLI